MYKFIFIIGTLIILHGCTSNSKENTYSKIQKYCSDKNALTNGSISTAFHPAEKIHGKESNHIFSECMRESWNPKTEK